MAVAPTYRSRPRSPRCRSGMVRRWLIVVALLVIGPILYIGGREVVGDRLRGQKITSLIEQLEQERIEAFRRTGGGAAYSEQI